MDSKEGIVSKVKDDDYYKRKYKLLRKTVIEIVHQNAALSSEIARTEDKVNTIKLERKYLMKKLMQYEKPKISSLKSSKSKDNPKSKSKLAKSKKGQNSKGESNTDNAPVVIKVKPINVDQSGRPIFPIELGSLSIYSIGEIIHDRPQYHNNQFIFAVGYCSTRLCGSSQHQQCLYTCKILEDGRSPRFEISPEDAPETIFQSHDITDAYLRFQNDLGSKLHDLSDMDAHDFFGLSQPTVQNLIQSLPGAFRCAGYVWKKIEVVLPGNSGTKSKMKSRVRQSDINIEALEKWARDT